MSIGTPAGQLIIENATVITNNINVQDKIGVVTNSPQYNLDVHGTANVGVLQATNIITDNVTSGYFLGDGGLLSNIAATLQEVSDNGNVTTNTLQFTNTHTAFVTNLTSNIGVDIGQLNNVTLTTPINEDMLVYDGTQWVNQKQNHLFLYARANGQNILKGEVVCASGTTGNDTFNIIRADARDPTKMPAIGIAYQNINSGESGLVVSFGRADGVATPNFIEGETVYVSNTVPGGLSNVVPHGEINGVPNLIQNVGLVVKKHLTQGIVSVTGVGRTNAIPNANVITQTPAYVYTDGDTNTNTLHKIVPANLLTKLQTLEQVVNTGNTVSNIINVTGLTTTGNVNVGSNISIDGLTSMYIPIIGSDNYLVDSNIRTDNGNVIISADTQINSNLTVTGYYYGDGSLLSNVANDTDISDLREEMTANTLTLRTDLQSNVDILQNTAITFTGLKTFQDDVIFQSNLTVGTANLHVDTTTGFVGVGTDTPAYALDVAGSAVFDTYMQVARKINQVSSSTDVVLLLTPNADGNRMSGTICGMDSTDGTQRRSGTLKLDVIVNTNSLIGGPNPTTQETFSFIKHAIINAPSIYTPVTCDYNGKNWFAIRIQGDNQEDPWYSWFSGLLQHTGGDDTLSIVSNDGVNVTNVIDFTIKEGVQHTEFSHQDLIVSGGNVGIGTTNPAYTLDVHGTSNVGNLTATSGTFSDDLTVGTSKLFVDVSTGQVGVGTNSPVSILHVRGSGQTNTTSFDTSQTLGASIFTESSDSVVGSGGSLVFGTYQGKFAAIKAGILDGSSNTMGNLHIMTRNATADATLTNRMTITNTGDVGIGVTSPLAKLHVNGDIYSPGVICQTQQYEYSSVGTVVITSGTLTLLNCLFTPKFSNSKILIQLSIPVQSSATYFNVFVDRGSTRITSNPGNYGIISYNSTVNLGGHFIHTGVGYDLPGTTSEISYNVVAEYGSGSALGILTQSGKLLVLIHELCQ